MIWESQELPTEDMIAYLKQHHDTNLHQDYLDHINTFGKFVLKDIPTNTIKTELSGLDRAKVERYKQMDFSKAPPIVMGDGFVLDGYHRAVAAKELGIPTIRAYVGVKGIMESVQAYHGTFQPTLNRFNPLSHFGTLKAAEDRLKEKARREKIKTPGRVYEVVLDIKNPFVAKDFAGVHSPTHFAFDLKDRKLISQEEMVAITHLAGDPRQAQALIKKLRELGFDSIAYKNKYEDKGSTSYVILDPSQVVSVNPVERQTIAEARMPAEVEDFLYNLSPDDAGVDEVGPYRIHYEGFTDDCQSSADYCSNPEAVYNLSLIHI